MIIVGLGNPGPRYAPTRHNLGFHVVDRVAEKHGIKFAQDALYFKGKGTLGSQRVCLVKPKTYMNRSGYAVREILRRESASPAELLVVYDDLALVLGRVRFRREGSHGGHRGVASIIQQTGFREFSRLKLGVGPQTPGKPAEEFVLEPFQREDIGLVAQVIEVAAEAIDFWLDRGIEEAMNRFNGYYPQSDEESDGQNEPI